MTEPLPPLTDEEIEKLAIEVVTNVVYMPFHEHMIADSFGMIIALAGDQLPPNAALVYEYWGKENEMAVNGNPTFFSCRFVPQESVEVLFAKVQEKIEALHGKEEPNEPR